MVPHWGAKPKTGGAIAPLLKRHTCSEG